MLRTNKESIFLKSFARLISPLSDTFPHADEVQLQFSAATLSTHLVVPETGQFPIGVCLATTRLLFLVPRTERRPLKSGCVGGIVDSVRLQPELEPIGAIQVPNVALRNCGEPPPPPRIRFLPRRLVIQRLDYHTRSLCSYEIKEKDQNQLIEPPRLHDPSRSSRTLSTSTFCLRNFF